MRVLVCGGRSYSNRDLIFSTLSTLAPISILIHGAATGADTLPSEWAIANKIRQESYPAEWRRFGKSAGPRRNRRMLEVGKPDLVLAFPGGAGTANMVGLAKAAGVEVREIKGVE